MSGQGETTPDKPAVARADQSRRNARHWVSVGIYLLFIGSAPRRVGLTADLVIDATPSWLARAGLRLRGWRGWRCCSYASRSNQLQHSCNTDRRSISLTYVSFLPVPPSAQHSSGDPLDIQHRCTPTDCICNCCGARVTPYPGSTDILRRAPFGGNL